MIDKLMAGIYARPPFGNDNQPFWQVIILVLFFFLTLIVK